ncbi:hypothetical protein EYF80_049463 [Liparis tanakae]|uniref:Uncharacterized protein n=1 Tax=Liparis tanakae TaxID=230148 RepID=A0A4Z2FHY7_9TELE|nr:hypothetical protein EYF80_049463 [Liparis tanakae]
MLKIVVVTAEVRGGVVLNEKGAEPAQEAVRGPVLGHRPHGVVAGHQQEVRLGPGQSLLQPRQLAVGVQRAQRPSGLLVHEVVAVAAQQDGVEHDDEDVRITNATDMEARRIHAVHASVVEVIAERQNKVGSHLLRHVGHFPGGDLLHGADVGGSRQAAPVPHGQEPDGGPVLEHSGIAVGHGNGSNQDGYQYTMRDVEEEDEYLLIKR